MHHFPGVRWDEWPHMPYEVVMACIDLIDGGSDGEG
jgi:hypothetical protein